jgi:hypothetical protein
MRTGTKKHFKIDAKFMCNSVTHLRGKRPFELVPITETWLQ